MVRIAAALVLPLFACADDSGGQSDEASSSSSSTSPTTTSPTATSVEPTTTTTADSSEGSTAAASSSESSSGGEVTLLERVALALGGAEELAALDGFVLTAEGTTRNADEGATPDDTIVDGSAFAIDLSVDVANAGWRLDHERTITFAGLGLPMQYSEIISGEIGAIDGVDNLFGAPGGAMPSDRWGAIVRRQQLLHPQLLVIAALADPGIATDLGPADLDGVAHDRLAITSEVAELVLWIDPATDLPVRLTTLENNWLRRDVELQLDYDGWAASDGGVLFAAGATLAIDGEVLHEETRSAISTTAELAPALFEIPPEATSTLDEAAAARGRMNHSLLLEFQGVGIPAWGFQVQVAPVVLAPAATHLTGGTHHSVIVEQANGLVLLETPLYEARCQALLDWAATEYPGKSVTHAVVSHYHVDHSGCARTLVARGATLVVGEGSDVVWTEVLAAPSTIDPDELSANPVAPTIEYVPDGGSFVIDDASAAVTVFDLPNSHSSDMVLPFVESAGLVFVADLFNPGTPAQLSPDGAQSLLDAFELYGITGQVDAIAAAHGFGTATVADLQDAVP
ncbi:MAG TPA: MBL fold metallo-hydrolase [Nannocystaceae bacterium]|nr:MBL fold metallo-hydrolase [Nannocystaceae bacterium]